MSDWQWSVTPEEVERRYEWAIEKKLDHIEAMLNCDHNCDRVPDKIGNPIAGETLVYRCAMCKKIVETPQDLIALIKGEN